MACLLLHSRSVPRVGLELLAICILTPIPLQGPPEPAHRVPPSGSCVLPAAPCQPFCLTLPASAPGISSLVFSALLLLLPDEVHCSQYFSLHSGIQQHALPDAAGIRCGGTDLSKAMAGVLLSELWTEQSSTFYSCLTFQCVQWKIK